MTLEQARQLAALDRDISTAEAAVLAAPPHHVQLHAKQLSVLHRAWAALRDEIEET